MSEQDTLARTIYGEARGEGAAGMQAIANVVLNRVTKPRWWGNDIETVCLKPWQFSCWNANDPNVSVIKAVDQTDPIFSQCLSIAAQAANGELEDNTGGATSYYDRRMPTPPQWAEGREPCASIGHHLFFVDA